MRLWMCSAILALATGCAAGPPRGEFGQHGAITPEGKAAWLKAAVAGDGPGKRALSTNPTAWQVRNLPKSTRGNPDKYTVGGESYSVLESAEGFFERGKASWYGRKFHGRETSSGEVYDMYQMTAAHKNLPIPTFVRVTRTDTGESIVVKVNDRGPFVSGRVIDLSYQAAATLGILKTGTAPVTVEALSTHLPLPTNKPSTTTAIASSSRKALPQPVSVSGAATNSGANNAASNATSSAALQKVVFTPPYVSGNYLQLGAFSEVGNAQNLIGKLSADTPTPLLINHDADRELYRVWVGPFETAGEHNAVVAALQTQGIMNFTMVPSRR